MHRSVRFLVLLFILTGLAARSPEPQDAAETKIRLLSGALHARDTGDLTTARANLQELIALAPGDETVKRLLTSLDRPTQKKVSVSGGEVAPPGATVTTAANEAELLARAEEERLARLLEAAGAAAKEARAPARQKHFSEALEVVARARVGLPENQLTQEAVAGLGLAQAEIAAARDQHLEAIAADAAKAAVETKPAEAPVPRESVQASEAVLTLVVRGRSQYLAGDAVAAEQTFRQARLLEPDNAEAATFPERIAAERVAVGTARSRTSAAMISEVNQAWQRPGVFTEKPPTTAGLPGASPLLDKLNHIVLPTVNFSGMELGRVVNTLSVISEEFDRTGTAPKGVNIVLLDQGNTNPVVNITLRNLSLKRVLDFITDSVGYRYEVQDDAIVVRPGGEQSTLETRFFPVSRSTVLRMTGKGSGSGRAGADPLAGGTAGVGPGEGEGPAIRNFLQLAGVSFEGVAGSTLAFDGSQLIATQTPRNLERIRNILTRYLEVRQVEIEAKFMEVQEGALEELGVHWQLGKKRTQHSGATKSDYRTSNRSINDAFSFQGGTQSLQISSPGGTTTVDGNPVTTPGTELTLPVNAPTIPGTVSLGSGASALASITGIIGEFDVSAIVRALSQKSGTELLSAPKLTVLSGNTATITVAQELRYPQSYGQIQSQVGTGSNSGGGSAGVSITSGTPQEFTTRNVGVELKVTPTVEEDDYSVSLDLNPKVTEFEGFVEYGGPSVAISGGTTVTVPPGFYQPIFAVREVTTKVTLWDGATLVMGGLTREDVKKVRDKVPVLGSIPGLGRLFRSEGESSQKRNLLIFVTANLVSPGGSLRKQAVSGTAPGSLYQNPVIVTPAGAAARSRE